MKVDRRFGPYIYGIVQSGITTAVATAIATERQTGLTSQFANEWASAWALAWLAMVPVVICVSPLIQRVVATFIDDR
jgi:ABC-type glycerol-3-phosphate transport system permease component